eukprot:m.362261 g.362261  ORF g.362261 m.362261 type:complete len:80 (+) comp16649_c1_seq1:2122-2361(+)
MCAVSLAIYLNFSDNTKSKLQFNVQSMDIVGYEEPTLTPQVNHPSPGVTMSPAKRAKLDRLQRSAGSGDSNPIVQHVPF